MLVPGVTVFLEEAHNLYGDHNDSASDKISYNILTGILTLGFLCNNHEIPPVEELFYKAYCNNTQERSLK